MICAVSRSGSTYLCELLASTLALGNPNEYFNTAGRRRRMGPSYPADGFAQIDIIRTIGATSNGIYAVKVIGPQLARIASSIDPFRDLPNLSFVRIHRRDILGQAISLARARQTGRFITSDQQRGAPAYSQGQIRHAIQSIRQQEAIWDETMARLAAQPLVVAYEEILSDAQHVVDRIATFFSCINRQFEILFQTLLTNIISKILRTQRYFDLLLVTTVIMNACINDTFYCHTLKRAFLLDLLLD